MKTPNEKSAGPRVIWVLLPPTNNSTNIVKKNPKKITEMRMRLTGLDFPKKLASMLSFYIFVVTNQPDISKGIIDIELINKMNKIILDKYPINEILYNKSINPPLYNPNLVLGIYIISL